MIYSVQKVAFCWKAERLFHLRERETLVYAVERIKTHSYVKEIGSRVELSLSCVVYGSVCPLLTVSFHFFQFQLHHKMFAQTCFVIHVNTDMSTARSIIGP